VGKGSFRLAVLIHKRYDKAKTLLSDNSEMSTMEIGGNLQITSNNSEEIL
jgi:hypothetical protein